MTHTPGPWKILNKWPMDIQGNIIRVIDDNRFPAAFVPAWDNPGPGEEDGTEEALGNARLIAAAPDLLAALKSLVSALGGVPSTRLDVALARVDAARAAIAKATGEQS